MSENELPPFPTPPAPDLPPPPTPPNPHRPASPARRKLLVFLSGVLLIFVIFVTLLIVLASFFDDGEDIAFDFSGDKVAIVELRGVIADARPIVDHLRKYEKDSSVKSIVLRIDSPGGGVAASQEIYAEVKRIRDEKSKIIVTSMGTVAASGGYYVACATDRIVANPGTITGSIGVIAQWTNYGDLFRWAKLKDVTFKSGEYKDTGSPTRDMSDIEQQYFQELVMELYEQFVASVAEGRKMNPEDVRRIADGRVFSGAQALKLGLVDEIGNLHEAVKIAGKLGGIKGEPRIVEPVKERLGLLDLLFGGLSRFAPAVMAERPSPFEYRWTLEAPIPLQR